MRRTMVAVGALVLSMLGSATADAQKWEIRLMPKREARAEHVTTYIGTSFEVGGGVADFTNADVRDTAGLGGTWNARAVIGTRSLFSGELGYVGTAQPISTLGLSSNAALVGNGIEANLRLSLPIVNGPYLIAPYVFGGVGWTRYDVMYDGANTSALRDADDVFAVPFGGGIAGHYGAYVVNFRYAFHATFDDELLMTPTGSTDTSAGLDHWSLAASIGYEF